jgi:hypothetical protein
MEGMAQRFQHRFGGHAFGEGHTRLLVRGANDDPSSVVQLKEPLKVRWI